MCLAVPGKIIAIKDPDPQSTPVPGPLAEVDFQGARAEVMLSMTPEAKIGSWVLVHAGFALTELDESVAKETWDYLREAGVVGINDDAQ